MTTYRPRKIRRRPVLWHLSLCAIPGGVLSGCGDDAAENESPSRPATR
jgi:hypothetical protein